MVSTLWASLGRAFHCVWMDYVRSNIFFYGSCCFFSSLNFLFLFLLCKRVNTSSFLKFLSFIYNTLWSVLCLVFFLCVVSLTSFLTAEVASLCRCIRMISCWMSSFSFLLWWQSSQLFINLDQLSNLAILLCFWAGMWYFFPTEFSPADFFKYFFGFIVLRN